MFALTRADIVASMARGECAGVLAPDAEEQQLGDVPKIKADAAAV